MSGEQQKAMDVINLAGLHVDPIDATWHGNPKAFKALGVYVEGYARESVTNLRVNVPTANLAAFLNPVTKEQAEKAKQAVMDALDGHFWPEQEIKVADALDRLIALLFPEEAPTDANPAGGHNA